MSEVVAGDERARLKAEIRNLPRDSETYDEELRAIDDVCIDVEALIIKTERGLYRLHASNSYCRWTRR